MQKQTEKSPQETRDNTSASLRTIRVQELQDYDIQESSRDGRGQTVEKGTPENGTECPTTYEGRQILLPKAFSRLVFNSLEFIPSLLQIKFPLRNLSLKLHLNVHL